MPDIYPHCGPLSGIHAALYHSELPVLALPVDVPLIEAEHLLPLIGAGLKMNTSVHYLNNILPAFIQNTGESKRYLERLLAKANDKVVNLSVKRFLLNVGCAQLTMPNDYFLMNVNTPGDWAHAQTLYRVTNIANNF